MNTKQTITSKRRRTAPAPAAEPLRARPDPTGCLPGPETHRPQKQRQVCMYSTHRCSALISRCQRRRERPGTACGFNHFTFLYHILRSTHKRTPERGEGVVVDMKRDCSFSVCWLWTRRTECIDLAERLVLVHENLYYCSFLLSTMHPPVSVATNCNLF